MLKKSYEQLQKERDALAKLVVVLLHQLGGKAVLTDEHLTDEFSTGTRITISQKEPLEGDEKIHRGSQQ